MAYGEGQLDAVLRFHHLFLKVKPTRSTVYEWHRVADLSEEDRRELGKLFPDLKDLCWFVLSNQHLAEVGVEGVLRPDTAYPPRADAYNRPRNVEASETREDTPEGRE